LATVKEKEANVKRYSLKEFVSVVEESDIIYGSCSLNAAMTIQSRVRKKSLLKQLDAVNGVDQFGIFAELTEDLKGRKILKLI
jgi:hypothetical protein